MLANVLSLLVAGTVILAVWLLPKYLERRVAEAARGAVDVSVGRTLADHRHDLDRQLEEHRDSLAKQGEVLRQSLALERERFSNDYQLFAGRRNELYAETYSSFERVRGAYSAHFAALTTHRDFGQSPEADLRHLAAQLELVSEGERGRLQHEIELGHLDSARKTANRLYERDSLRKANQLFIEFRNACVLHSLYFSKEVADLLEDAARRLALFSVFADELIEGEKVEFQERRDRSVKIDELVELASRLRNTMREEMRAGFTRSASSASGPAPRE